MNLRDQLTSIQNQLAEEKSKTLYKDLPLISQLEEQEAQLLQAIMVEDQNMQNAAQQIKIQQDHEERVTQSTDDFFNEIENLDISNGMTLRDVMIDETFYQSTTISIKGLFQAGVDGLSQQIAKLEGENSDLTGRLKKETEDRQKFETDLNQERLDHAQTQQYRTNIANLLEEAQKEITQLQEQLKAANAGVKTTNTEEEQRKKAENDAKIKLERTVYNVIPDNPLNIKSYSVNLAATGEAFSIPYYALKSYIVIPESEVSQFRAENGIAETTITDTDNTAAEPVTEDIASGVTEGTFPTVPSAEYPEVSNVIPAGPVVMVPSSDTGESKITEEYIEDRLAKFAQEFGLVKGQVA